MNIRLEPVAILRRFKIKESDDLASKKAWSGERHISHLFPSDEMASNEQLTFPYYAHSDELGIAEACIPTRFTLNQRLAFKGSTISFVTSEELRLTEHHSMQRDINQYPNDTLNLQEQSNLQGNITHATPILLTEDHQVECFADVSALGAVGAGITADFAIACSVCGGVATYVAIHENNTTRLITSLSGVPGVSSMVAFEYNGQRYIVLNGYDSSTATRRIWLLDTNGVLDSVTTSGTKLAISKYDNAGKFLLAARATEWVATYWIDPTAGSITPIAAITLPQRGAGIAVHPYAQSVVLGNSFDVIVIYTPTLSLRTAYTTYLSPYGLVITPSGDVYITTSRFFYKNRTMLLYGSWRLSYYSVYDPLNNKVFSSLSGYPSFSPPLTGILMYSETSGTYTILRQSNYPHNFYSLDLLSDGILGVTYYNSTTSERHIEIIDWRNNRILTTINCAGSIAGWYYPV